MKVRLASSSSSPPVPAITTRLSVRSSTLKVFACPPALISSKPEVVVTPAISTLSRLVCPSTSKSPLASIAPEKVDIPNTLTYHQQCVSTSRSRKIIKSTTEPDVPVNVVTPATLRLSRLV